MRKTNLHLVFIFLCICIISCEGKRNWRKIASIQNPIKSKELNKDEIKYWFKKDIVIDSIPGISLNRTHDSIIPFLDKGEEVVVALIDMSVDIDHKDLKGSIWVWLHFFTSKKIYHIIE